MTQPVQEPTPDREIAAIGWRTRQLARRPAPTNAQGIPWIRLYSETPQSFAATDRQGVIYPDSVTNEYPDVFDYNTSGGEPFSVAPLVTGLYQATVRIGISDSIPNPHPDSGCSLELLGTDYMDNVSGYDSVFIPGSLTAGGLPFPPTPGIPFSSGFLWKIDHMFMAGPEFFDTQPWEIESYITTADALELFQASLEVRLLGPVNFFPYPSGS